MCLAIIKKIAFMLTISVSVLGCASHGYMVSIKSNIIDQSTIKQVKTFVEQQGFTTIAGDRQTHLGDFIVSYRKDLSPEKYDFIRISLLYSMSIPKDGVPLLVNIKNEVKGGDPFIKAQIDTLGDELYKELSISIGSARLSIERKSIKPPILY